MMSLEFAVLSAVTALRTQGLTFAALELAELSLSEDADQGRLWEAKGVLHSEAGQIQLAREALETANCLVPLQPEGRFALAECYAVEGHRDLSKDLLCSLIDWDKTPVELLLRVADCLDWLGRPELAVQACREASRRDSHFAKAFYALAYYLQRSQSPAHLIESVARQAIRLDPKNVSYRIGLALFLSSEGRLQDAAEPVSELTPTQLHSVVCANCLDRIAGLYLLIDDTTRSDICQSVIAKLTGNVPDSLQPSGNQHSVRKLTRKSERESGRTSNQLGSQSNGEGRHA